MKNAEIRLLTRTVQNCYRVIARCLQNRDR
jgi:hypothetical protein